MPPTEILAAVTARRVEPDTGALGIIVLEDVITHCNERFCRMVGIDASEVVGKSFLELCPEFQADGAFSHERWTRRWHAARAGLPQWFPWQFRRRDGSRAHGLVHLDNGPAGVPQLLAQIHDLTALARVDWATPGSQARAQEVLDHFKAIIFVKDRQGRYLFANRELERAVRTPADRVIGRTDHEIWQNEIADRFQSYDAKVLQEKRGIEYEVIATVGGQPRSFLGFKFPLFAQGGELYGLCCIGADITDRKRTQDALANAALAVSSAQGASVLQELVRYLATILEADAAMIAVPGPASGMAHIHAFFLDGQIRQNIDYRIAGTPCETVFGQAFRIYPSGLRERFTSEPEFAALCMESYAGFPLTDNTGAPVGLIAALSRKPMADSEFIESILKIFAVRACAELERQRTEETLRRSEASYRAIFEASEDAIFVHDWDTGRVIDVNRRACEIYGYSYEELKSIRVGDVSSNEHPYTAAEARKKLEEARAGRTLRFEWHRRNKDGSLHWDEVVVRNAVIAGERRILAFTREITERKQAEQALRQAQKMEALGHLTGGIAHDFNNLLTSIMGYVVLAGEHPAAAGEPRLSRYLEQAHASCVRARDLIQQMLTFSRGRRGQPRPVSLAPLVRQSVKLFESSLPSALEMRTLIDDDVPAVLLDPVHLDQILLNLCLNARDATSGVGAIEVSIGSAAPGEHVCTACRQSAAGPFVELCVADDGPGIAPEVVDRMFEPFFTTKEAGKGSGMGLATVHGIVHELGGHIVVETGAGKGTRFRVLLPALAVEVTDERAATASEPAPQVQLQGHVLVVDDDQSVSLYMRALLENWGLTVTVAASAAEAVSLVKRPVSFDIVVTDQMMPKTTGIELAKELARLKPELPVILYTGYAEGITAADAERAGLRAVLMKPVDPRLLFGMFQTHLPKLP